MRTIALTLVALLLAPAAAAASKEPSGPVRVLWNSAPADTRAPASWDVRLSLLQGPGGYYGTSVRPRLVIARLDEGGRRLVPMRVDTGPNTFRATLDLSSAGRYSVGVTRFDPRHPARVARFGSTVAVTAAPSTASWTWIFAGVGVAAVLVAGWAMTSQPWSGHNRANRLER